MNSNKTEARKPNKAFNSDSWAFAFTLLLVGSCFSGIHLPSWRG